ncbi:hypothetical protein MSHO_44980 [Mycobacterium shottsii]|uniref:Uncharacterized protein n=1 Tax=Mycobacterium shottsii TaxID=133549 RepID=A0A7I7LIG4_9MYCO|nr:hypothetical protein MSHO_44980 [Mycobacterium shottsii]
MTVYANRIDPDEIVENGFAAFGGYAQEQRQQSLVVVQVDPQTVFGGVTVRAAQTLCFTTGFGCRLAQRDPNPGL